MDSLLSTSSHPFQVEEARALRQINPAAKVMVTREVMVIGTFYDSINLTDPALISAHWFIMCPGPHGAPVPCASRYIDIISYIYAQFFF